MLSGWRIAAPEFAATANEMMSGEGAFLFGGRWNSKGMQVVYLGSSLAQASMELLVHLGRAEVLQQYCKMEVLFDEAQVLHIALEDLPADWAEPTMTAAVQAVGDAWVADQGSLILQVPSAVVVGEYNYLFNPLHPDSGNTSFGAITPFDFDHRILK